MSLGVAVGSEHLYGQMFVKLLSDELQREEAELQMLAGNNPNISLKSMSLYYERWLQCVAVKGASRNSAYPKLWVEDKRSDFTFVTSEEIPLADFELKGPIKLPINRQYLTGILEDFSKQQARFRTHPSIPHYVLLLPWGPKQVVENWLEEVSATVNSEVAGIDLSWVRSQPIALNGNDPKILCIAAASVRCL